MAEPSTPQATDDLSVLSVLSVTSGDDEIERAILATIPVGIGRRHTQVVHLARALKAIPRFADAPVDAMKPHVRRWHKIGLERKVIGTEPFEETWIDFINAWPRVNFTAGSEPLALIVQRAKSLSLPAAAQGYESKGVRLLIAICRELQKASGDKPFFLSCRTAGKLLELGENGHIKAWRWLGLLVHDGILAEIEKGKPGKGRASRYCYSENGQ